MDEIVILQILSKVISLVSHRATTFEQTLTIKTVHVNGDAFS
jgi:hypothetical protein